MRRRSFILAIILGVWGLANLAWAEPKILSRQGSLVIETQKAGSPRKNAASEDTLFELQGQEVQVFIFNNRTRVWPRVYGRPLPVFCRAPAGPRDGRIDLLIRKYSQRYGVDPGLVQAVMRHESGFNPGAVSPKGAQGLMQLMPGTSALMGVKDPFDPEQNIAGGVGYLRRCLDRFQHNVPLAVAAYNAGPERVAQCGTIPPINETQLFVNNVMGSYTGRLPAANPKVPAASPGKTAKAGKKAAMPAVLETDAAADPPRRPRPKIIEVRSRKIIHRN